MSRIVLAMSGGVDSSVAAALLCQQGHDVIGVFMRHGADSPLARGCATGSETAKSSLPIISERPDHKQGCCSASDAEDGRCVADRLGIPFYALNLEDEFSKIIDYFIDEYTVGRTPNPCIVCNNWIKFGKLFDYADSVGADFVATGHYAQLASDQAGRTALHRGRDVDKDQSYVLFGIKRSLLDRMKLPVGGYQKKEIRSMAADLGLRVADKKDSQEICFVTSGKHDEFIRSRRTEIEMSGEIVTTSGEVVGKHAGIEGFTIGQRKGLGVAFGEPRFVVRIDAEERQVVVGTRDELACNGLTASRTNWLSDISAEPFRCHVQIRYNSTAVPATAQTLPERRLQFDFDDACYGVAPGQAVVCFDQDRVLGGGWIE
ncbi:MAG: tRNA 2-thiouridine(34) synthase MnmA [Planctomycetales bacterium]